MSKSYKKNPILKAGMSDAKKFANRRVRRTEDIPSGNKYRKFYPQWDVVDQWSRTTLQEHLESWEERQVTPIYYWRNNNTIEEEILQWKKWYFWK